MNEENKRQNPGMFATMQFSSPVYKPKIKICRTVVSTVVSHRRQTCAVTVRTEQIDLSNNFRLLFKGCPFRISSGTPTILIGYRGFL